ncbi:immunoglobulin-like domain-containing protein, partial [Listeria riparia]|uniref:immunoglobulin-like domain-containing protein n=1 Tax=Listeria riparia TaxID=1494964 RepID=UPI00131ED253
MLKKEGPTNFKKSVKAASAMILISGLVTSSLPLWKITTEQVNAASTQTNRVQADSAVIALVNGDFENPVVTTKSHWKTFDANSVPGWRTTASDNLIEIQENGLPKSSPSISGNQWAELNAYEVSALYQDIPTTPGVKVRWQVYHKGRYGVDTAVVEFGAPDGPMAQQAEMVDNKGTWGLYTGEYTIPEGQTTTRFQFRSVSAAGGDPAAGNLLDNVQFATQSVLDIEGSFAQASTKVRQGADYTLHVTNVGGMPAANNTISVQIPTALNYTAGSLSSANTTISNENYDATTRTLTFKIDVLKKDATADITIPMTGTAVTNAATPSTSATYNDQNFADTYTAEATDDAIAVTSNELPVITGEAQTVVQPNTTFDPMLTMAATDKEDGDLTTRIVVVSNPVDTSKSGAYDVTYEVTDSDGNKGTFTRHVIVEEAPVITGEATTKLNPNSTFDPMSMMQATDKEDGDITAKIQVVSNSVDTSKPGNYEVTYEVTDTDGNQATFTRTVKVTEAPVIAGEATTKLNPNSVFDPMSTMQATDKEDGDITAKIQVVSNSVDTSKPGNYEVTYE